MNSSALLNAKTETFGDLLSNGKTYAVPPFQRDYSWTEEEWEDLWFDLVALLDGEEEEGGHYMGYAVLQTHDGKRFEIIDGQQRFATLSILALAVLRHIQDLAEGGIEQEANEKRLELLRARFIGHVIASSLTTVSKLQLNRNDNDFYQSYLVQLRRPPTRSRAKPSEQLLQEAFDYFWGKLKEHFAGQSSGERLATFLESAGDKLLFTVITVSNELRAYRVFETLNARGVKLSSTDLLKNYLFSLVHARSPADLPEAERRWQRVTDDLAGEDFPTFARHLWNATEVLTRRQALFKSIKARIRSSEQAFSFLDRLERSAPFYVALRAPEDPLWTREEREWLTPLRLFGVSHFYPLALAAWEEELDRAELARLLRVCAITAFRYNIICGFNPSPMEDVYSRAALKVRSGELTSAGQMFRLLRQAQLYIADEVFQSSFAAKSLRVTNRTKRLVRYILGELEAKLAGKSIDVEAQDVTIEHLLPEQGGPGWDDSFSSDEQERSSVRLANYTLLEASLNREANNRPWTSKREVLRRSAFKLTTEVSACPEWTPKTLVNRADQLAKLAVHIWRLDY